MVVVDESTVVHEPAVGASGDPSALGLLHWVGPGFPEGDQQRRWGYYVRVKCVTSYR